MLTLASIGDRDVPMYTFHLCNERGASSSFEAYELEHDASAFAKGGVLLNDHQSCHHVDIREGERPVAARHREAPVVRPIFGLAEVSGYPSLS